MLRLAAAAACIAFPALDPVAAAPQDSEDEYVVGVLPSLLSIPIGIADAVYSALLNLVLLLTIERDLAVADVVALVALLMASVDNAVDRGVDDLSDTLEHPIDDLSLTQ